MNELECLNSLNKIYTFDQHFCGMRPLRGHRHRLSIRDTLRRKNPARARIDPERIDGFSEVDVAVV